MAAIVSSHFSITVDFMANGLISAYALGGSGSARTYSLDQIQDWRPEDGTLWLHFDYAQADSQQWIRESGLPAVCVKALLSEETRPRATAVGDGVLMSLRGVNLNPSADPEDMVSIRIYADKDRVITSRKRRLLTVSDVTDMIEEGVGPKNTAELIALIVSKLTERIEIFVDSLEERADDLEEGMLVAASKDARAELVSLRRESIILRRYLAPQREAMAQLAALKPSWLSEECRVHIRETADQLTRLIENLDAVRDRAAVVHEELANQLSEQMNQRMYVLSIVSVVFIPLGFLTGLLGINVGGIPGADNSTAFTWFLAGLGVLTAIQFMLLRRFRWL